MILRKYFLERVIVLLSGMMISLLSLSIILESFRGKMTEYISHMYDYNELNQRFLYPGVKMRYLHALLQESGLETWMFLVIVFAAILPFYFLLKDFYQMNCIRTILRLPIPRSLFYLDKLLPSVLLLGSMWFMQYTALSCAQQWYFDDVPAITIPDGVVAGLREFARLSTPLAEYELLRLLADISFLLMLPSTVILFILASRSKRKGILSGIIASLGVIAGIMYLFNFPVMLWVVPGITAIIIVTGIWHVHRVQII